MDYDMLEYDFSASTRLSVMELCCLSCIVQAVERVQVPFPRKSGGAANEPQPRHTAAAKLL
jgi:hypothetical protein